MPLTVRRDDAGRRWRWTATPPLTLPEVLARLEDQVQNSHHWRYGLVIDLRTAILPSEDRDLLLVRMGDLTAQMGPHGPVALVTQQPRGVASSMVYAYKSAEVGLTVEVFWDLDEAEAWVGRQLDRPESPPKDPPVTGDAS